ncbi:hypothetical protein VFPPC_18698 [Pochonia chlamydosporia 170]|uniref:Uncharacterized protein n=1 Tax=Pochonia chlamydosporia 170 TaxID=1380566 RepID=A0A219ATR5_METCM|nr:hypothetical protein VFPPC_18698 [Pochonia chlamydosporia 170]OWT43575.1 hypothetical protein VFPPC_18698 [Pochonia chlamydosporia 170]
MTSMRGKTKHSWIVMPTTEVDEIVCFFALRFRLVEHLTLGDVELLSHLRPRGQIARCESHMTPNPGPAMFSLFPEIRKADKERFGLGEKRVSRARARIVKMKFLELKAAINFCRVLRSVTSPDRVEVVEISFCFPLFSDDCIRVIDIKVDTVGPTERDIQLGVN